MLMVAANLPSQRATLSRANTTICPSLLSFGFHLKSSVVAGAPPPLISHSPVLQPRYRGKDCVAAPLAHDIVVLTAIRRRKIPAQVPDLADVNLSEGFVKGLAPAQT